MEITTRTTDALSNVWLQGPQTTATGMVQLNVVVWEGSGRIYRLSRSHRSREQRVYKIYTAASVPSSNYHAFP